MPTLCAALQPSAKRQRNWTHLRNQSIDLFNCNRHERFHSVGVVEKREIERKREEMSEWVREDDEFQQSAATCCQQI